MYDLITIHGKHTIDADRYRTNTNSILVFGDGEDELLGEFPRDCFGIVLNESVEA